MRHLTELLDVLDLWRGNILLVRNNKQLPAAVLELHDLHSPGDIGRYAIGHLQQALLDGHLGGALHRCNLAVLNLPL